MKKVRLWISTLATALVVAAGLNVAAQAGDLPEPPDIDLSTQPTLYVVGYAHLDTQWRWTYVETIRDYIAHTLHDNFALMDKYPDYVFNFGGSRRYEMMEEYYPEEFERLKQYVATGQWFPSGSSVDENDANVPSAESLIRHVLYGNRYFQRKFGVASDEYMLPDCFGFPAALPSVLAHCGIKGFSTQKLTWGSAVGIPFKVGVWEGPDGRGVIAALDPGAYVGEVRSNLSENESWITRVENNGERDGLYADYHYYGTGDMGGAPSEPSVVMIEKSVSGTGPLKVISGPAEWLFQTITPAQRERLPRYQGELLLTEHSSGSITSQAMMKRWNRKNELLADAAERAAVAAWLLGDRYPAARLELAWSLVLGSQMHDILPGTSHPKAYEYSWNDELIAANQFAAMLTDAVGYVASSLDTSATGTPVVVYNPLSIEREDVVEATVPWRGESPSALRVVGPDGSEVPSQVLGAVDDGLRIAILARVPSVGFAVFDVQGPADGRQGADSLRIDERTLENERYRVSLNDDGDVASIFDKQAGREMLASPARLALQYEKPRQWPAWNMDWSDRQQPPRSYVDGPARFRIVEEGPVRVALEITREHEGSTYVQSIRLASGDAGDRVEFDNRIDWTTRERSLKASFKLGVSNPLATYDLQVGAIERDNNNPKRYENPSHLWFDLTDTDGRYGITVTNDSKFGSDKPDDSTLRLTLLYTPGVRGSYQDQGTQDIGRHEILYALAGHTGDWRSAGTPWIAQRVNQPLRAFNVATHNGPLGRSFSLAACSDPDVMISALKKAEDGHDVVIRLREMTGDDAHDVRVALATPIESAAEIDGQERRLATAGVGDGRLVTDVGGYSLRAFSITPGSLSSRPMPARVQPLTLPFDADVVSMNADRTDGAVEENGRSYPAEQLPETVTAGDVTFRMGPTGDGRANAVRCRGQAITIPEGDFDRIELLAASVGSDEMATFGIDGESVERLIPSWRGYIGQWDNRVWSGDVPDVAYAWSPKFAGLVPGYVKPTEVAWFCSHHHASGGDQYYEYCYLFKIGLDVPPGARTLTLPDGGRIVLLAATAVTGGRGRVTPAAPLFDTLDDREQDAPLIEPDGGSFSDATELHVEPHLYGRADAIRFTLDGTDPTAASPAFDGPMVLHETTTVRAAVIGDDGTPGPIAQATIEIDDRTSPQVVEAAALFNQPRVEIEFSEPLDTASASDPSNYSLSPALGVQRAELDDSARRVTLTVDQPLASGQTAMLHIRDVTDRAPARNAIRDAAIRIMAPSPVYHLAEAAPEQRGSPIAVEGLPVKSDDAWTLNMFVRADTQPPNRTVIAGFGACAGRVDGGARYICKFGNGIHFWSHHADLPGRTPLELGRWQMITATFDGRMLRLYRDGEKIAEREADLADDESVVNIAPLDPWERRRQFEGDVREVTIWDVALDEHGIRSLLSSVQLP